MRRAIPSDHMQKIHTGCIVAVGVSLMAAHADEAGQVIKDIEFAVADGHSLKLDLYLPEKPQGSSLLVWIHGGGWRKGSREKCLLNWLPKHGYTVASISYRLSDVAKFPAQLHDCKAAVRWLRAHAPKYGYRTGKIAVAGASAGGHLQAARSISVTSASRASPANSPATRLSGPISGLS